MSNLIKNVSKAIRNAENNKSGLNQKILALDGMSSPKIRHFLNNILNNSENKVYLEIGVWKGSTFVSALYSNPVKKAYAIDNWSEFCSGKENFKDNIKLLSNIDYTLIEANAFEVDLSKIHEKIDIYFYDGGHSAAEHQKAIEYYYPILNDEFLFIVDDWNDDAVKEGTLAGLSKFDSVHWWTLPANYNGDTDNWWNGLFVAVIRKKTTKNIDIYCITKQFPDYLYDALYLGFQNLGCNIVDSPRKATLHGERPEFFNNYPLDHLLFNFPKNDFKKETVDIFLVMFDPERNQFYDYCDNIYKIKNSVKHDKFVMIDGLDGINNPYPWWFEDFDTVFIRELYTIRKQHVFPINFCAIPENFDFIEFKDRKYDVSFVASSGSNKNRSVIAEHLRNFCETKKLKYFIHVDSKPIKRKDYLDSLHNSRCCISVKGAGQDCYRYWEIAAHGTVLITEKLDLRIENDFTEEHCFRFSNKDDLNKLLDLIKNTPSEELQSMSLKAMAHTKLFHKPEDRAQKILDRIFRE